MADQWYYARNNQKVGPVTSDTLRRLANSGQVVPSDMVWCEGMAQWAPAGQVPNLFPGGTDTVVAPAPMPASYAGGYSGYAPTPLNYRSSREQAVYAGFWLRFCALFIDGVILAGVMYVIGLATGAQTSSTAAGDSGTHSLISVVIYWLYFSLMESSSWQATLGKRLCGIQVTDLAGDRVSFGRATGRHFGKILSTLTLCIGYLMAAFTANKQALHDMIAGTLVVRR